MEEFVRAFAVAVVQCLDEGHGGRLGVVTDVVPATEDYSRRVLSVRVCSRSGRCVVACGPGWRGMTKVCVF
jgi:hypothetical protein